MASTDRAATRLGRTQRIVLHLLATNAPCTVRELAYHWPGLTESSVGAAVRRLGDRRLVDVADRAWQGARSYALTDRGLAVEAVLIAPDDPDAA